MLCYKPEESYFNENCKSEKQLKEDPYPTYHFLEETNAALRFFTNSLKEIQAKPNPDPYEIYYLLRWTWKVMGYNDDSLDKIIQKPERRIMKAEHKEFIEAARNLMDTFFVCFGDPGRGEVKNRSYTIPMALLEISKALNRIADEMAMKGNL